MKVMEVADINFTVHRHVSGGNKAVVFGSEAAFLYGEEGVVPIRQKGATCRLAFVTLWGGLVVGEADNGHLLMRADKVEVREVPSSQVQSHLKALKRRGWAPKSSAEELDKVLEDLEEVGAELTSFEDGLDFLVDRGGFVVHMNNCIWAPGPEATPVIRDNRMAIATAVIFNTGRRSVAYETFNKCLVKVYPVDEFISHLGIVG